MSVRTTTQTTQSRWNWRLIAERTILYAILIVGSPGTELEFAL